MRRVVDERWTAWEREVWLAHRQYLRVWGERRLAAVLIGAIALAMSIPALGSWCIWSPDCFWYLTRARCLAETGSFPAERLLAPPGLPVLLAPLIGLYGELPLFSVRVLMALCWAAVAGMTYLIHRRELGERWGMLAGVLVAMSTVFANFALSPLSEPVFTALLCGLLIFMERWHREGPPKYEEAACVGLLAGGAVLIRSMGIAILPIPVWLILRCGKASATKRIGRVAVYLACAIGPLLAWELRQRQFVGGQGYGHVWTEARSTERTASTGIALQLERLAEFGPKRIDSIKEVLLPKGVFWRLFNPPFDGLANWLIGGGIVVLAIGRFAKLGAPQDGCLLATIGILSLWPYDEGVRLVVPLVPILVAYPLRLAIGLRQVSYGLVWGRRIATVCVSLLLFAYAWDMMRWQTRIGVMREKSAASLRLMAELAAWETAHLPAGAAVLGITPERSNAKLLLAGAAYLGRHSLRPVDIVRDGAFDVSMGAAECALVHRSLEGAARQRWGLEAVDSICEFAVFRPADSPSAALRRAVNDRSIQGLSARTRIQRSVAGMPNDDD